MEREGVVSNVDITVTFNALIKRYDIEQRVVRIMNKKRRGVNKVKDK